MPYSRLIVVLASLISVVSSASALEIREAVPGFYTEADFTRITDYLAGRRGADRHLVARSDPGSLRGLYYRVRLDRPLRRLPSAIRAELSIISAAAPDPVVYSLALPDHRPVGRELFLGLTGADWPHGAEHPFPVAWKIVFFDSSGQPVAERRSFVWGTR